MNLSGIAVTVNSPAIEDTLARLDCLPGVEVHYKDASSGRIIVVQEAETVDAEVEGLKHIKAIPGVIVAEMVYHYFADDPTIQSPTFPADDTSSGISDTVLQRLNPN